MSRTVYEIKDVYGEVIAEHVRVDWPGGRKRMYWQTPGCDPRDGLYGIGTSDLPLYGSETIGRMPIGETVLLVEGEKTRDALLAVYPYVLATVTGSSGTPGEEALAPLIANDVVTWEDHQDGADHMRRVAARLIRLGGSARRLVWDGAREKGDDGADWLARGGTRVTLDLMLQAAEPWRVEVPDAPKPAPRPVYEPSDDRVDAARSHLVEVVTQKLGAPGKRDGRSLFWCCPFHAEKSPSFKVDLREPFYRCFGCGARGDVFTFLREMEGLAFIDALGELAPSRALGGIPRMWG